MNILMPCVIDMEDGDGYKMKNGFPDNETLVSIISYEANQIAQAGFLPMCYASSSWFQSKLNDKKIENLMKWVAWWNVKEEKIDKNKYHMWQQTSKKHVKGINGNVDFNVAFVDFPEFIKYTIRFLKIVNIKEHTKLNDMDIQFFRLYKYGDDLINKLYERLKCEKIKDESKSENAKWQVIMEEVKLELQTIQYLKGYYKHDEICEKIYSSIVKGDDNGVDQ